MHYCFTAGTNSQRMDLFCRDCDPRLTPTNTPMTASWPLRSRSSPGCSIVKAWTKTGEHCHNIDEIRGLNRDRPTTCHNQREHQPIVGLKGSQTPALASHSTGIQTEERETLDWTSSKSYFTLRFAIDELRRHSVVAESRLQQKPDNSCEISWATMLPRSVHSCDIQSQAELPG